MAHGRLPGSTSYMQLQVRRVEVEVVCIWTAEFCLPSLGSLWFRFDDFPRKGSERARRRSSVRGRSPTCLTADATHFFRKSPRRGNVHAVQSPNSSLSKGAKSYHAVRSRRCPKSDAVKKKSKFFGNLPRSGVRVRGLGLVWTSALTRSDRHQHQTRSRTRHRNLTRLVSHVLLTSLMTVWSHEREHKFATSNGFFRLWKNCSGLVVLSRSV